MNGLEELIERFEEETYAIIAPPPPPPDRMSWLEVMLMATGEGMLLKCGESMRPGVRFRRLVLGDRVYAWLFQVLERFYPPSTMAEIFLTPYEMHWAKLKNLIPDTVTEDLIAKLERQRSTQTPEHIQQWRKRWDEEQRKLDVEYGFLKVEGMK